MSYVLVREDINLRPSSPVRQTGHPDNDQLHVDQLFIFTFAICQLLAKFHEEYSFFCMHFIKIESDCAPDFVGPFWACMDRSGQ